MKIHRPTALNQALELLDGHGEDARVLAGGTAFTLFHKLGLLAPEHVISTRGLTELEGVRVRDDDVVIGAMTRLRDLELDPTVCRELPVLASTLRLVANLRVRNAATVGGNLAEADPSSDPPAVLTALDARATLRSLHGERVVPLTALFVGYLETVIQDRELLTEVTVPAPRRAGRGAYVKLVSRHAEDRTCLGVAAFVAEDGAGACSSLRVCVIGSDPRPLRLSEVESAVLGRRLDDRAMDEVAAAYVAAAHPVSDHRGSSAYRRRVMGPLVIEALRRAQAGEDEAVRW